MFLNRKLPRSWIETIGCLKGTLIIELLVIIIGILTRNMTDLEHHRLLERLGFCYDYLFDQRILHLLTGTWVQSTPGIELSMIGLIALGAMSMEWLAGTELMIAVGIVCDWLSTVASAITIRMFVEFGKVSWDSYLSHPDSGSSAFAHGVLAAAVMLLPRKWLPLGMAATIIFTFGQFFVESPVPAMTHVWAIATGSVCGLLIKHHDAREHSAIPAVHTSTLA